MIPGLVSVSFRKLSRREILTLCEKCGLKCIEWGGDIHVPAGDIEKAKETAAMSADFGVKSVAYGSYFRLGNSNDDFKRNLETAAVLNTPVLRIWAGTKGSGKCTEQERDAWVEQLAFISSEAKKCGIDVAPEFHINTLTDSMESLRYLLKTLPEQKFYWQPRWDWSEEERLEALGEIGDRLTYIHVFTWRIEDGREIRLPLADGESMWTKVLSSLPADKPALMEFVANDDPDNLIRDAEVFTNWLKN